MLSVLSEDQIEELEVSQNATITDSGVRAIKNMSNLRKLKLEDLSGVAQPEQVLADLKKKLQQCDIEWPPFTEQKTED